MIEEAKKTAHLSERWKKGLRQLCSLHPWKDHRTQVLESIPTQGRFWKKNRE